MPCPSVSLAIALPSVFSFRRFHLFWQPESVEFVRMSGPFIDIIPKVKMAISEPRLGLLYFMMPVSEMSLTLCNLVFLVWPFYECR